MPKAEAGTAKHFANQQKAKGLTRLRFYCQVCEKPCRDENGYKCHIESESHMRRLQAITGSKGELAGKVIDGFSQQFQDAFVSLLSRRYGTRRIKANTVYNEYIQERHHLHMNATRWLSLTEFCKHLGREGIVKVEEDEQIPGTWFLSWVDNSPGALARQDALMKLERAKLDDESRQRRFLEEQIRKAHEAAEGNSQGTSAAGAGAGPQESMLMRDENAKPIKIGFGTKLKPPSPPDDKERDNAAPAVAANGDASSSSNPLSASALVLPSADAPSAPGSGLGFKLGMGLRAASKSTAPAAGFNALKAASSKHSAAAPLPTSFGASASAGATSTKAPQRASIVDQIIMDEMEKKRRKEERERERDRGQPKRMRL
ncbi:hypothetical protein K437DRAFT_258815 [Tilletiaria anomala UBC 951]|uniref:DNA/RNA-binding protein Kin17 WH-like domain-containing protein n=1 Tax=Tilletiaria anomala (strain ATCC 24038 / CBS 436.72 / UBC 951) TaxID=1037660 RepID=A0A066VER8_TILAU|nr:uncharacterized protein K437DRAFT_258815 [Tilletiaria anomala UBC 951]KDN39936.1 hypothetical protein K437DRAFT_258815 [Tilletiaria anomala UBC 951]